MKLQAAQLVVARRASDGLDSAAPGRSAASATLSASAQPIMTKLASVDASAPGPMPGTDPQGPIRDLDPSLPWPVPAEGETDYYDQRNDDFLRRHADLSPPDYYLNYGEKYVLRFTTDTNNDLTDAGKAWLASARINLQLAIESQRSADPGAFDQLEQSSDQFTQFAYSTHAQAYIDAGLDGLPLSDLLKIAFTPDFKDLISQPGLEQVGQILPGILEAKFEEATGKPSAFCWDVVNAISPSNVEQVLGEIARGVDADALVQSLKDILGVVEQAVSDAGNAVGNILGPLVP